MNFCNPMFLTLIILALAVPASVGAQQDDPSRLTVERIYGGDEFKTDEFSAQWLKDGSSYTTLEDAEGSNGSNIVRHDPVSGNREVIVSAAELTPPGESQALKIDGYSWSEDNALLLVYTNSKRVWRRNTRGDFWLLDRSSHELRKLGGDAPPSMLMFAKLSPDERSVAYVRERNIYVEDLYDHSIRPLTQAADKKIINGTFDWVYEEELGLRDGFRWSPDSKSVAYWQLDTTGVREFPLVNNTDSLYPVINWIPYPKVGQQNSAAKVGVVDVETAETRWIDVPGDPRKQYIARMDWAKSSQELLLQVLNRAQNENRLMLADIGDGKTKTILTETDEAWVDIHDELKWLDDGARFTWISERGGWRHAYVVSRSGGELKLTTQGDYDVIELLHADEEGGSAYFIASPNDATQRYLYRVGTDGGGIKRLTPETKLGWHDYDISPNGRWAIHTASSFDDPPIVELVSLPEHKAIRVLAENAELRKKISELKRQPAEFFRVDVEDGVLLDGWCIKPQDLEPDKKYPLLVHVYGEPAGTTVTDRWAGKTYLWHLMLAQQGRLVMSFDNRGTRAPRGRAWRKSVHRKIGVMAPKDQAAALKKVIEQRPYVDPERVGVWGWSGGGSSSLHAIFKYPNLYKTAIAVAPVPNQRYYDTIYQERYMGLPSDNVEGFTEGSPINFAHQLEGDLLLIHGTGDDNCHYQTTEMLIDELIRHDKPFSMMSYPNRTHAIKEGKNTTKHLRELMTRYLQTNLPPGGVASPR